MGGHGSLLNGDDTIEHPGGDAVKLIYGSEANGALRRFGVSSRKTHEHLILEYSQGEDIIESTPV